MMHEQVKVVGKNGKISLGKEFAGKMVIIVQVGENTLLIKSGNFIPDSEKWLYEENHLKKLEKSLEWAEKHHPKDNFEQLVQGIKDDKN